MPSPGSKSVKKEDIEDDDKSLGSILRGKLKKPATPKVIKKGSVKSAKVNKVERFDFESDDDNPISKKSASTDSETEKKKNKLKKEEIPKKEAVESNAKKRERKVYDLPGQKRDPPEERDPMRIFYESLYHQVPDSEMAAIWMMESGLLPEEEARKVLERKQKKNQLQKLGSPMKVVTSSVKRSGQSATKSVTVKKATKETSNSNKKTTRTPATTGGGDRSKKRKKKGESESEEEDSEDDFVISKAVKRQRA